MEYYVLLLLVTFQTMSVVFLNSFTLCHTDISIYCLDESRNLELLSICSAFSTMVIRLNRHVICNFFSCCTVLQCFFTLQCTAVTKQFGWMISLRLSIDFCACLDMLPIFSHDFCSLIIKGRHSSTRLASLTP